MLLRLKRFRCQQSLKTGTYSTHIHQANGVRSTIYTTTHHATKPSGRSSSKSLQSLRNPPTSHHLDKETPRQQRSSCNFFFRHTNESLISRSGDGNLDISISCPSVASAFRSWWRQEAAEAIRHSCRQKAVFINCDRNWYQEVPRSRCGARIR